MKYILYLFYIGKEYYYFRVMKFTIFLFFCSTLFSSWVLAESVVTAKNVEDSYNALSRAQASHYRAMKSHKGTLTTSDKSRLAKEYLLPARNNYRSMIKRFIQSTIKEKQKLFGKSKKGKDGKESEDGDDSKAPSIKKKKPKIIAVPRIVNKQIEYKKNEGRSKTKGFEIQSGPPSEVDIKLKKGESAKPGATPQEGSKEVNFP